MIKYIRIFALFSLGLAVVSCADDDDDDDTVEDGNWVKRSSFEGVARSGAVAFVVGDKAYVGLGYDGDDYLTDFWSYDPEKNFWQRVEDFPGIGRTGAVAFAIGNSGYVGTGYDGTDELKDFWKYDVESDSWTQIDDFAGSARIRAIAFTSNEKGYVGTGFDGNYLKDIWQYDPAAGNWEQVVSIKGEKRESAVALMIEDQIFVGTGTNNGIYQTDFWEFDAANIDWISKENLTEDDDYTIIRASAAAFSIGESGYITTGNASSNISSTWAYDPILDTWTEKTSFEGSSRQGAVAFTVNGRGYVALGQNSSSRFDDLWEFKPLEEYNEDD